MKFLAQQEPWHFLVIVPDPQSRSISVMRCSCIQGFLQGGVISFWVELCILSKYLMTTPIRYPNAKLTLTLISWLVVQSKWRFYVWPLYFVVFVHEWLCMYEQKHFPVSCLITPVCYNLKLQWLDNWQETSGQFTFSCRTPWSLSELPRC
jgi:hypothetical protein